MSNISWEVESDCTKINCDLLLLYHIPHAMFVDLDQIKSHKGIKVSDKCVQMYLSLFYSVQHQTLSPIHSPLNDLILDSLACIPCKVSTSLD